MLGIGLSALHKLYHLFIKIIVKKLMLLFPLYRQEN